MNEKLASPTSNLESLPRHLVTREMLWAEVERLDADACNERAERESWRAIAKKLNAEVEGLTLTQKELQNDLRLKDETIFALQEDVVRVTRERDQALAELNSTNGHWPEIRRLRAERTGLHGALVRVRLEVSGCPPDCSHDFHRLAIKSAFKIANDALKRSAEPTSAPETKP